MKLAAGYEREGKYIKQTKISPEQRIDKWLLLATIFFSRIAAFLSSTTKLHNARFAAIHELESLMTTQPDKATSLLLGQARMNHVLAVRPQEARTELGNLLVVASHGNGHPLPIRCGFHSRGADVC